MCGFGDNQCDCLEHQNGESIKIQGMTLADKQDNGKAQVDNRKKAADDFVSIDLFRGYFFVAAELGREKKNTQRAEPTDKQ